MNLKGILFRSWVLFHCFTVDAALTVLEPVMISFDSQSLVLTPLQLDPINPNCNPGRSVQSVPKNSHRQTI